MLFRGAIPPQRSDHREYSRRHVTEQGANPPGLQFCGGLLRRRHTSADKPSLSFRDPPWDARWVEPESTPSLSPGLLDVGFAALTADGIGQLRHYENLRDGF